MCILWMNRKLLTEYLGKCWATRKKGVQEVFVRLVMNSVERTDLGMHTKSFLSWWARKITVRVVSAYGDSG